MKIGLYAFYLLISFTFLGCEKSENTKADSDTDRNEYEPDGLLYPDMDSDGYGDGNATGVPNTVVESYPLVFDHTDCNDTDASIHPGSPEVCDGIDQDCDGEFDNDVTGEFPTWYMDGDGDGFGDVSVSIEICEGLGRFVLDATDCNDYDADIRPGATEVCDNIDNDCDSSVDDDAVGDKTWYEDSDGDGYGSNEVTSNACEQPEGYVPDGSDCDDETTTTNPAAKEACDNIDNDCDDSVDEDPSEDVNVYWVDGDGDGYGSTRESPIVACSAPSGYTDNRDDCDDSSSGSNPTAEEVCDDFDNDCDGATDEGYPTVEYWPDDDGDGYGNPLFDPTFWCDGAAWPGYVTNNGDCDDAGKSGSSTYPGATEVKDGVDNNCDGSIDES